MTSIGYCAFQNCTNLRSVTLPGNAITYGCAPDTVWSDSYAFSGCASLSTVILCDGFTTIGDSMFSGCISLGEIVIPDSVTYIGSYAFGSCTSLTSIAIPDSVTSIGERAFKGCIGLTSMTVPFVGAEKDGTTNAYFNYIFDGVPQSLKTVVVTGGTSIGSYAFAECTALTSVWMADSVEMMGTHVFSDCTALSSVDLSENLKTVSKFSARFKPI